MNQPSKRDEKRRCSGKGTVCLAMAGVLLAAAANAGWQAPLSITEQVIASDIALATLGNATASDEYRQPAKKGAEATVSIASRQTDANVNSGQQSGLTGVEVLLVETREQKKSNSHDPRLAEVFLFSYELGTTMLQIVNLDTGENVLSRHIDSVHLPLNDNESQYVQHLLKENPEVLAAVNEEHQRQYGRAVIDLSAIDMKISIWQPTDSANRDELSGICLEQRCALVSLFTRDYFNFSIEPVVNLMSGAVHPERR